jgi:hypothetical protein
MNIADLDRKAVEIAIRNLERGFDWQAYLVYKAAQNGANHENEAIEAAPDQRHIFSCEMSKDWTAKMHNADGTKGPHWTFVQAKKLMERNGISYDACAFWATLNMVYSDYCAVARKYGVNKDDFYIDLAKAFLLDADAKPDKLARYYEYVAG